MELFEALYTTRAMRRLKPDPIPDDIVAKIIDAGIRAPSGGNVQAWRFMTVTDHDTVAKLGELYLKGWNHLLSTVYANPNTSAVPMPTGLATRRVGWPSTGRRPRCWSLPSRRAGQGRRDRRSIRPCGRCAWRRGRSGSARH